MNFNDCLFSDYVQKYDDENNLVVSVWRTTDNKQHLCVGESFAKSFYAGCIEETDENRACQLLNYKYLNFLEKPEEEKPPCAYDTIGTWVNYSLYHDLIYEIIREKVIKNDRAFKKDPVGHLKQITEEAKRKNNYTWGEDLYAFIFRREIFNNNGVVDNDFKPKDVTIPYEYYLDQYKENLWRCNYHSIERLKDIENNLCLVTWATTKTKFHMCIGESFNKMIYVGFFHEEFAEERYRKFKDLYYESIKEIKAGKHDNILYDTDGYWIYKAYSIEKAKTFDTDFEIFFNKAQEKAKEKGLYKTMEELMIDYRKILVIGQSLETL